MTLLSWPSELPRPDRNTWQTQAQDPRQKRPGENGPPGYRRMFSSAARNVSMSITITRNQKAIFDAFYLFETSHGSVPFTMADPTTDGWALYTASGVALTTAQGDPILLSGRWLCQFGEAVPTERIQGVEFVVSFSIVVMP